MLEEGDIVLCTVDRIVGTNVFVKIDSEQEKEGVIVFSEIAPGRIRNIRDYVVPKKKIVCKVLRISGDRIDLSLRRVTQKEQKELKEKYRQTFQAFYYICNNSTCNNYSFSLNSFHQEQEDNSFRWKARNR